MASPSCHLHRVTQAVLNNVHGSEDRSAALRRWQDLQRRVAAKLLQLESGPEQTLQSRVLGLGPAVLRRIYAHSKPSARRTLLGLNRETRSQILGDLNIWDTFGTPPLSNHSVALRKGRSGFLQLVMTVRAHERQTLFPLLDAERMAKLEKLELHIYSSTHPRSHSRSFLLYAHYDSGGLFESDGSSAMPTPNLGVLVVDCQRRWDYTVPMLLQHRRNLEFEEYLWRVPATLFVSGSSLRRCSLRGTFALPTPTETKAFVAVHEFSFEGPVWVSADDLDSLVVGMPALRSLAVICLRFEPRKDETHRSHDHIITRRAYSSLNQIYVGTLRNYNDDEMVQHVWHSGASDIVASSRPFTPFHFPFPTPRADSALTSLSCSTGGMSLNLVRTTSITSPGRIRYCGESVVASSRLLRPIIFSPTIDITNLRIMSLHEHAFLTLCVLKGDDDRVDDAVVPMVTFPNVTHLTIWLASCCEHSHLGSLDRYGDPKGFLGLLSNTVQMTPDLPCLDFFRLTRGNVPRTEGRMGRPVTHCSSKFFPGEMESRYRCCCERLPVISLRDLHSFLEVLGRQVDSMADQLDLQICALDCVDVDLAGTFVNIQRLVRSIQFIEASVRCEVSPVRSEIVHEAPVIFDLLGSP